MFLSEGKEPARDPSSGDVVKRDSYALGWRPERQLNLPHQTKKQCFNTNTHTLKKQKNKRVRGESRNDSFPKKELVMEKIKELMWKGKGNLGAQKKRPQTML